MTIPLQIAVGYPHPWFASPADPLKTCDNGIFRDWWLVEPPEPTLTKKIILCLIKEPLGLGPGRRRLIQVAPALWLRMLQENIMHFVCLSMNQQNWNYGFGVFSLLDKQAPLKKIAPLGLPKVTSKRLKCANLVLMVLVHGPTLLELHHSYAFLRRLKAKGP